MESEPSTSEELGKSSPGAAATAERAEHPGCGSLPSGPPQFGYQPAHTMESEPSTSEELGKSSSGAAAAATAERAERSKHDEIGSLLPILPDDVTMNHILPRLPWRAMMTLTLLNRAWRETVRSREVHEVRERASASQTIVTIHQYECIISMYDTATGAWHRLPRPPFGHMLVARGCGCVTMHGKLYILGGNGEDFLPRNAVHVFELGGAGRWKECASMKTARKHFACAGHGGKIYVFGGIGAGSAAEVYDPEQDTWSSIAPMLTQRIEHKLVTIDGVFCVHMGRFLESSSNDKLKWGCAHFAEIYDPRKDVWTKVDNFAIDSSPTSVGFEPRAELVEAAVVMNGKLYGMLDDWLYVYEEPVQVGKRSKCLQWDGTGSWKAVQAINWDVFGVRASVNYFNPFARVALAVPNGGELLALVFGPTGSVNSNRRWTFLKSEGFGSVDRKLMWKRIEGSARSKSPGWPAWTHEESYFKFAPCIATVAGPW